MTFKTFFLTLSSHIGLLKVLLYFLLVLGTTLGLRKEIGVWVGGGKEPSTVPGIMGFFSLQCLSILHHSAVLCCTEIKV